MVSSSQIKVTALNPHFGCVINNIKTQNLFELDRDFIVKTFQETGVIVFRGFQLSIEDFIRFTEQFTSEFSTYKGGGFRYDIFDRESISADGTVMSTTGAGQGFPIALHGEMYYLKNRPRILWFVCQYPPKEKGQTTLCSGVKLFENLSSKTKELLRAKKIRYVRKLNKQNWPNTFQTEDLTKVKKTCDENDLTLTVHDDESITTEYVCSPLVDHPRGEVYINNLLNVYLTEWAFETGWIHKKYGDVGAQTPILVRFEDGSRIPGGIIDEIKLKGQELQSEITWQQGDIAMIDNSWVMHGRNETDNSRREIYARMGEAKFD